MRGEIVIEPVPDDMGRAARFVDAVESPIVAVVGYDPDLVLIVYWGEAVWVRRKALEWIGVADEMV